MSKQNGFSLIEVLISAVIIGVAAIVLARFQGEMMRGTMLAGERNEAVFLAQTKLEEARQAMLQTAGAVAAGATTVTGRTTSFTVTTAVGAGAASNRVQVTVAWTDAQNAGQRVVVMSNVPHNAGAVAAPPS
ncbi:prepilin-type N-terminal cleavage/methylation domain-containing protein [Jeongeupia sp. USM3]|uniref:type IV pilus modification PilV family protein n=1 Tax=Jeongeupia sp. USM3 TaxID=1906741 RepID=UPI00143AD3A5|nr:prepilin-type N-terminal cleavage/methylation domain-containing protein [Jeongeupia sp. USM3]